MSPEQIRRMSAGELYEWMGLDADRWALAFAALAREPDHDVLRGWFANAIMAGFDRGAPTCGDHAAFRAGSEDA